MNKIMKNFLLAGDAFNPIQEEPFWGCSWMGDAKS